MHACPVSRSHVPSTRRFWPVLAAVLALSAMPLGATAGTLAGPSDAPRVKVSLVAERPAARPGEALPVAFRFELDPHWHVYWQNPGDSGEAPRARWTLPEGWTAGPIDWPAPTRIETGPLVNYGYEGDVLLPTTLTPSAGAAGPAKVALKLTWLVCREDCIPGKAVFEFELPVTTGETAPDATWAPRFEALRDARPAPTPAVFARADGELRLSLPELSAPVGSKVRVLAADEGVVPATAEPTVHRPADGGVVLTVPLADTAPAVLDRLVGLVQIDADVQSSRAIDATPAEVTAAPAAPPPARAPPKDDTSIGAALLFALLGGLLLNLMPCVFPVLSLKILAFVEHADDDPRAIRRQGWLFTAGVLVAFWALAGALIALRAGGEQLGWGFQLQSPGFVAALAVLMFGLALSLAGVFEVGLSLTSVGGSGNAGAFGTGVLATVVATPCTAPFMGPAIGFALTRSPVESMAVFSALGLGMALPYLILSFAPKLLARLPRPGPWMVTFRQFMAFPLFATVLWLIDVFLQQAGVPAAGGLIVALLALAFAGWFWGRLQHSGRTGPVWALLALLVAAPGGWLAWASTDLGESSAAANWQPWSPAVEAEHRAAGKAVFVNFTAAWCISCKVNERVVFERDDVQAAFARNDVVTLIADWTDRNDEIARTLTEYGREGVPLYLYHPPARSGGEPAATEVLPSILTPDTLIALLDGEGATPEE